MSRATAVKNLFVAFGAARQEEQSALYVHELTKAATCGDCCEIAVEALMRTAKRLPTLAMVLEESAQVMGSPAHTSHIVNPQLAPRAETWWRSEAVKVILPKVGHDRDAAAYLAAVLWFAQIDPDTDAVLAELETHPNAAGVEFNEWVDGALRYLRGKDAAAQAEAAFRRARFQAEHPNDPMPLYIVELQVAP